MRAVAVSFAFAISVTSAGCLGQGDCSAMGCASGITFRFEEQLAAGTYDVRACVDETCASAEATIRDEVTDWYGENLVVGSDDVVLDLGGADFEGEHRAQLTVRNTERNDVIVEVERQVTFQRVQPNGPDCPPTCWGADTLVERAT